QDGWSHIAMGTALWFPILHEKTSTATYSFLRINWGTRCTETGSWPALSAAKPGEAKPAARQRAPKDEWCGSWAAPIQLSLGFSITATAVISSFPTNPAFITRS